MAPVEEIITEQESGDNDAAAKPVIGIIYPPPEVRNIVDKTASFVARNGPEFETRIRQNEINNPKFNFLNSADPYHAYYQHKVKEFREGRGQEPVAPTKLSIGLQLQKQQRQEQEKIIQDIIPKEPPPEFEFIADPPSISAFDLDVVKLTAQFVARNGRQFLTNLMNREQRNYQFDFLRPQHSLFNYFTKLVEQYTKILIPPKDLLPKLRKMSEDPKVVLDQGKRRVEWARYQERERQKEAEEKERERVSYAQIDWHDFVVVETVDFQPNEQGNLPPPTTPDEVGARLLAQERFQDKEAETVEMEVESEDEESEEEEEEDEAETPAQPPPPESGDVDTQIQDMEEESDEEFEEEGEAAPPAPTPKPPPPPPPPKETPQPPPLPPTPGEVIVKDYNPKAAKQVSVTPAEDNFLVSPITGEKIPADKIRQHMRIGLLDPKWREQQEKMVSDRRGQEDVYAPGSAIDSSLKQLAERRTDIFGSGAEEAQIGKKIGEEEKRKSEKAIWDGHTASMEKVTQKARENISIEQQIAVIHKAKGLLPDDEKEKIGPAVPTSVPKPPTTAAPKPPPPPPMPKAPLPPLPAPIPPKQLMSQPMSKPVAPPTQPLQPPPVPVPMPPQPPRMMMMRPPQPMGGRPMLGRPPMPPMMPPRPPMGGMPPRPFMGGMPPPRPPPKPMDKEEDEPPAKKAKSEDQLIPEADFMKTRQPGQAVSFRVTIPNMPDKNEWDLNGQTLNLTLPLTDNVSVIKAKLHETLSMPAGKQKLQLDGMFVKDSNTLAFYNFLPNCVVNLQLKERGGRKK